MSWVVEPAVLLAFAGAGLALNLTPGADMMFTLAQGLRAGRRAAMAANAGIAAGGLVQTLVAALGLGALVAAHPLAFDVIRWVGVGYLLVLAVQTLRAGPIGTRDVAVQPVWRVFFSAMLVNVLNPKVILFILALLPQFIEPSRPVLPQFMVLGVVFATGGFVVNGLVGLFAGSIGQRLAQSAGLSLWLGRASAGIYAALALRLALVQRG